MAKRKNYWIFGASVLVLVSIIIIGLFIYDSFDGIFDF
jgi:hypothetical protein